MRQSVIAVTVGSMHKRGIGCLPVLSQICSSVGFVITWRGSGV